MQITAKLNHLRIAPRKVRLVADLIRKKKVEEAQAILSFTVKRASGPILKLLNSAAANIKNNFQIEPDNLYISKITVDEGPKLKRWRARARGRAVEIQKKTSHITIELAEIEPGKKAKKAVKPAENRPKAEALKKKKAETAEKKVKIETPETAVKEIEKPELKKPKRKEKIEAPKPKERGGIRRFFRRKSF